MHGRKSFADRVPVGNLLSHRCIRNPAGLKASPAVLPSSRRGLGVSIVLDFTSNSLVIIHHGDLSPSMNKLID